MTTEQQRSSVLAGLRVVEVGQYVAAPLAATMFADLGAEVVKVERPGGDPLRADAARFAAWNRGKRMVELDLKTDAGRQEVGALLDEADILVENLRPGVRSSASVGGDPRTGRPRLVTCSISAWGSRRPVPGRSGLGAAGPCSGRCAAGPLHR